MIHLLQGATILEVFYKRGSTLFNEDVLDFHHIKEQLKNLKYNWKVLFVKADKEGTTYEERNV